MAKNLALYIFLGYNIYLVWILCMLVVVLAHKVDFVLVLCYTGTGSWIVGNETRTHTGSLQGTGIS